MRLEQFLRRVAEREGVGLADAARHTRAVFGVLRETVGEDFRDVTVQLPDDYVRVLAR
jgi:uncharacterized protein (DUF2267 family)